MSLSGLIRTQYWNVSGPNPTPRTGITSRAESRTDVEGFLMASDAARNTALHDWGVAAGLRASAVAGAAGVTIAQGTALDADGHVVVLGTGGVAIVDPQVGPTGVQNIPTVPVGADGVTLDTATLSGSFLLTVTWREVEDVDSGLLVLRQAPWLRLVDPGGFADDGVQIVLAAVALGAGGVVEGLEPGPRRLVGLTSGRIGLSLTGRDTAAGLAAGQARSAELAPRDDGGVELSLLSPAGGTRRALAVAGGTGELQLDGGLRVAAATSLASGLTVTGGVEVLGDLGATGNLTAGGDLAVAGDVTVDDDLDVAGDLRAATTTLAALTVSGSAALRGATQIDGDVQLGAGLTAAGPARLDRLAVLGNTTIGAGGDAVLITRHIRGKQSGADGPDGLFLNFDSGQTVHVGGGSPADLVVSHNAIIRGRVGVKTGSPGFDLHVSGTICATTFCNPSDLRLKTDIADLVGVLDRLASVRAVTFTPTGGEPGTAARRQAGVLAQEVVRGFPELVLPMGTGDLMAVDYAGLVGVLVGAVNELRTAHAALTLRLDALDERTPVPHGRQDIPDRGSYAPDRQEDAPDLRWDALDLRRDASGCQEDGDDLR
ncbi:tail fiber domain-containing protein [Nonomuraea rubra]|uniref:tail fiber domain-containing protein n=1 Tax=Nonomuraea rubra TaxID=46180 RepID=UPI0033E6DF3E